MPLSGGQGLTAHQATEIRNLVSSHHQKADALVVSHESLSAEVRQLRTIRKNGYSVEPSAEFFVLVVRSFWLFLKRCFTKDLF